MAQAIVASSQITLVDLNDAKSLSAYITSTQPKIQIYNPNDSSYTPNWTSSSPVLTPELYVTGTATNIIANAKYVTWYEGNTVIYRIAASGSAAVAAPAGYSVGAAGSGYPLTISTNKLSGQNTIMYTAEIGWTDTTFGQDIVTKVSFDFSKVQSGQVGPAALTAVLSNENATVPADNAGNVTSYANTGTDVWVYEGTTALTYIAIGGTPAAGQWTFSAAPTVTNITLGAISVGTTRATIANASSGIAAGTDSSSVVMNITGKRADGTSFTLSKTQTITKSKAGIQGNPGNNATSYWLTTDVRSLTRATIGGALTPGTITINAFSQTGTGSPGAYTGRISIEEHNGTAWSTITQSSSNMSPTPYNYQTNNLAGAVTYTPSATAKQVRVRLYAAGSTVTVGTSYFDEETVLIISDNAVAYGVLNNDNSQIPTLQDGSGGDFSTGKAQTIMSVWVGSTDDSNNWTYTLSASTGVTASFASGTAGTVGARTVNVTAMTNATDSGTVTITAAKAGSGLPNQVSTFTVSKNKQGIAPTTYWLVPSVSAIQKNISNVFTPANISVDMRSQTGSASPAFYGGRLIISETTDGSSYTAKFTSSANETAAKSYTPSATNIKAIKVDMYVAGTGAPVAGTTTLVDTEIITVVSDGATGFNSVIANCWTPGGNVLKNDSGQLTAQCDVYDGSTAVTASSYQWYKFVTGTADQGGGANWLKLAVGADGGGTTNYTTATLTIPASAIDSMAMFKCIAAYNNGQGSKNFSDVVTVVDQSDPIQISLISAEGNVYRNGVGTKNITAKIYRNGTEIDVAGTGYEYRWYIYDANGTAVTSATINSVLTNWADSGKSYKTGKTVAVAQEWVTNVGNLVVELWSL